MSRKSDKTARSHDSASETVGTGGSNPAPKGGPDGPPDDFEAQVERYARRPAAWRSPVLMVLVIGICGWLLWSMSGDFMYFFAASEPISLGCEEEGYDLSLAEENAFVQITGLPGFLQAQYKQLGKRYRVYHLIGTRVFVRERLDEQAVREGDEHPVYTGKGMLLDLREERQFARLRSFFEERGRFQFNDPAWILLDGVEPKSLWWVPVASVVIAGILVLNLVMLVRRFVGRRR